MLVDSSCLLRRTAQTEANETITDDSWTKGAVGQGMNHSQASILEYVGDIIPEEEEMSASNDFGVDIEFGTEIMNAWATPPRLQ